jgi:hypothetical protein
MVFSSADAERDTVCDIAPRLAAHPAKETAANTAIAEHKAITRCAEARKLVVFMVFS